MACISQPSRCYKKHHTSQGTGFSSFHLFILFKSFPSQLAFIKALKKSFLSFPVNMNIISFTIINNLFFLNWWVFVYIQSTCFPSFGFYGYLSPLVMMSHICGCLKKRGYLKYIEEKHILYFVPLSFLFSQRRHICLKYH